jgi:hypothetical protein
MNVRYASATGPLRPHGADGLRTGGRRLRGTLPQVRDDWANSGDLRRSAASAVGAGAAQPKIATPVGIYPAFAFSRPWLYGRWPSSTARCRGTRLGPWPTLSADCAISGPIVLYPCVQSYSAAQ